MTRPHTNRLSGGRCRQSRGATLAVLLTVAALTALTAGPAAAQVGLHQWSLRIEGEATRAVLWYPSSDAAHELAPGPFLEDVAVEGKPQPGRFPLILLSHGSGGTGTSYERIAEALTTAGFVVAAVDHVGDTVGDTSRQGKAEIFSMRPRQLSGLLDAVLADPSWGPRVDAQHIGAIGHSAGGYTVLALAGAVPDVQLLVQHCRAEYASDGFCSYGGNPASRFADAPLVPTPLEGLRDPRVKAVVALAPIGAFFTPESLRQMTVPILLISGKKDDILPERFHAAPLAEAWGARARWISYADAGHFSFISPVQPAWKDRLAQIAADPPGLDRPAFQKTLASEVVAFFRRALQSGG
jgi:predicted dienelactone hydrolase